MLPVEPVRPSKTCGKAGHDGVGDVGGFVWVINPYEKMVKTRRFFQLQKWGGLPGCPGFIETLL